MKSIKDLREQYNLITEKEEHDMNKLTQLVRAGLFDAKKLSALKRAMDKPADKMTAQEKRMMINLLDALMAEVLSDKMVYRKIKQDVMKEAKDYYATPDPRVQRVGYPSQKEAPSVLLLKRKAIRVFPDGQKVALYYAQAIDKYVSIPYNEIGINEEVELDEISLSGIASGVKDYFSGVADRAANNSSSGSGSETKYLEPLKREPSKLDVGASSENNNRPDAIRSRTERLSRLASQEMAKGIRENFQNKLEVLREFSDEYEERMRFVYGSSGGIYSSTPYGGGAFGGAAKVKPLGDTVGNLATKPKPSGPPKRYVPKRKSPSETPDRRRKEQPSSPRGPGRYVPEKPQPQKKPTSPNREDKPIEQPKPGPKRAEPDTPGMPKPGKRVEPPKVKPIKIEPKITPVSPERREPDVKPAPKKPTSPAREEPAYKPKPAAKPEFPSALPAAKPAGKPSVAPTQQPSSQPAPLKQPENQPWKDAAKWAKTQGQPATEPKSSKKKPDEEGTKKREPEEKSSKRRWWLPGLALGTTPGKDLIPLNPKLKLPISAPKREGDADAIKSRQAAIERAALKAQASMNESVDLDGNMFELNNKEAEKVVALYESLNKTNKKKMVKMMNESSEGLEKVISFAVRQ